MRFGVRAVLVGGIEPLDGDVEIPDDSASAVVPVVRVSAPHEPMA